MELIAKPYRNWIWAGLLVQVITAWFSVGYFHPDEHYQILEFANYKLGFSPLKDLPWEYSVQCRGAIQPFIVYLFAKLMLAMNVYSPVILAFLLRLFMGVFTWFTIARTVSLLLPEMNSERGRIFFVAASFLLWFVPYTGVRFSAETLSADCFFLAISMLIQVIQYGHKRRYALLFLAGMLLGFTIFIRLQMGFAFIGLALWLVVYTKLGGRGWLILIVGGLLAAACAVCVDHWFYGNWVFTPYNYFNVNIIQNVAAKFGVDPWWYYFKLFWEKGIFPISLVLLYLFFSGMFKKATHVMGLVCITFFLGHFLIGHKEMRFLFPMAIPFIFICSVGMDGVFRHLPPRGLYRVLYRAFAVLNVSVLLFKMVTPAEEVVKYYSFLYDYAQKQPATIVSFKESPFKLDVIECNFYKPQNLEIKLLHSPSELRQLLQQNNGKPIIFLSRTLRPGKDLDGYKVEKLYCEYPDALLQFNINHWEERSYIWAVYRILPG